MKTVMIVVCILGLFSVGCGEEIRPGGAPDFYDARVADDRQEIVNQDMDIPDLGSVQDLNVDLGADSGFGTVCTTDANCNDDNDCTFDRCVPYLASQRCTHQVFDNDGDGYFPVVCLGDDCNDDDPTIHPGAAESCDGVDNNCSGNIDEDVTIPGSCVSGVGACQTTGSYTCVAGEAVCNAVPATPSTETCDLIDNDCDGAVDEDDLTILCRHYASPTISCAGHFGCAHNRYTGEEDQICVHAVPCLE